MKKKNEKRITPENPKKEKREKQPRVLESLEGSIAEVENEIAEEEQEDSSFDPYAPVAKNRRLFFVIGLITAVLAVVGLVTVIKGAVGMVEDMVNQTALKEEFAAFLYPVVITDAPAFENTENAPPSAVINAAIWRIIMSGNTDKYENDGLYMTVSEIDVESAAVSLFGHGVPIQHQTVGVGSTVFSYNEETKSYLVPVRPNYNSYWPRVSEISNVGELFTVTVEYMPPSMYVAEGLEYTQTPDKTMIYTVSRTASSMTVNSISYGSNDNSYDQ